MAGSGNSRWIILLNKSPKGPLTAEEVLLLLEKGVLRHNDIAYRLPESPDSKAPTEWKLLWQFVEFERRQEPDTITETSYERRTLTPPVALPAKKLEELPADLLDIAPEDLIPRSTALTHFDKERPEDVARDVPVEPRPDLADLRAAGRPVKIFGAAAAVLLLVVGWIFFSGPRASAPQAAIPAPEAVRAPAARASGVKTPSRVSMPQATPRLPIEAPRDEETHEADVGEIPEPEEGLAENAENSETDADSDAPESRRETANKRPKKSAKDMPSLARQRSIQRGNAAAEGSMDEGGGDDEASDGDSGDAEPSPNNDEEPQ